MDDMRAMTREIEAAHDQDGHAMTLAYLQERRARANAAWRQDKRGNRHREREFIQATAAYVALYEHLRRRNMGRIAA